MRSFTRRHPVAISILFLIVAVGPWLAGRGLQNPDELRYAEVAREMVARGDFIIPHLDGLPFLARPPLLYWLGATSLSVFGPAEWVLRLSPLLAGVLLVSVTASLGCYRFDRRVGLAAGLVAASSVFITLSSQFLSMDLLVAALITAALAWFLRIAMTGPVPRGMAWLPLYVLCGLAVLAKGLIGVVLPALVVLPWIAATRRGEVLRRCLWWPGVAVFLIITLPWHILVQMRYPAFFEFYIWREHFLRFTTREFHRDQAIWFLPLVVASGMLPWAGFLPGALRDAWRRWRTATQKRSREADDCLFLLIWAGVVFGFFWSSDSQLPGYVLPLVCPLAVLAGRFVARDIWSPAFTVGTASCLIVILAATIVSVLAWTGALHVAGAAMPPGPVLPILATASTFQAVGCIWLLLRRHAGDVLPVLSISALVLIEAAGFGANRLQPKSLRDLILTHQAVFARAAIVDFHAYLFDPVFYLKRQVFVVAAGGDLAFGASLEPEKQVMISDQLVLQWAAEGRPLAVLTDEWAIGGLGDTRWHEIGRAGHIVLLINFSISQ